MSLFITSPLEQFEVVPLLQLQAPLLGDLVLAVTNLTLYSGLALIIVLGLHWLGDNSQSLVPSRWSVALESGYVTVSGIVREQVGSRHEVYTPLVVSLFWYLLVSNLGGNIPYGYTVATSAVAAMGLSLSVFLGVTTLALYRHGLAFFAFFVPSGTPLPLVPMLVLIELISYLARAVSLGVRLFANMVAGHTLLKILATFLGKLFTGSLLVALVTLLPFGLFVALCGLELAVSLIQAYVFVVLTCSYLKDALELH